jgi:hypothetical protein
MESGFARSLEPRNDEGTEARKERSAIRDKTERLFIPDFKWALKVEAALTASYYFNNP